MSIINNLVILSEEASFAVDNSMFVVEGNNHQGYVYNSEVFNLCLGLRMWSLHLKYKNYDGCFVGDSCPTGIKPTPVVFTAGMKFQVDMYYKFRIGGDTGCFYEALLCNCDALDVLEYLDYSISPYCINKPKNKFLLLEDLYTGFYMPDHLLSRFIEHFQYREYFKSVD